MNINTPPSATILLDLIHSGQMTAEQAEHLLEDNPEFAAWYRQKARPPRVGRRQRPSLSVSDVALTD